MGADDTEIPYTVADRDMLTTIRVDLRNLITMTERRIRETERTGTALHARITKEADKSEARDTSTNSRIDTLKLASVIAGAVLLIGGLIGAVL